MPILRSHANAWRFVHLDIQSRSIRPVPIWRTLRWRNVAGDGWYGTLGDVTLALYRSGGRLYLQIGDEVLPLDDHVTTELVHDGEFKTLRVFTNGRPVSEIRYAAPRPWPPLSRDFSAGVEEEQVDFGLFLHHIIRDPERRARLISQPGL